MYTQSRVFFGLAYDGPLQLQQQQQQITQQEIYAKNFTTQIIFVWLEFDDSIDFIRNQIAHIFTQID